MFYVCRDGSELFPLSFYLSWILYGITLTFGCQNTMAVLAVMLSYWENAAHKKVDSLTKWCKNIVAKKRITHKGKVIWMQKSNHTTIIINNKRYIALNKLTWADLSSGELFCSPVVHLCLSGCPFVCIIFHIFRFFFRNTELISTKFGIKNSLKGIQVNLNKGPCPFPRGDKREILVVKIHWQHLKLFLSRTTGPISTNKQSIFCWREFNVFKER